MLIERNQALIEAGNEIITMRERLVAELGQLRAGLIACVSAVTERLLELVDLCQPPILISPKLLAPFHHFQ